MPTIKELVLRQLEVDPEISLKNCQKVVKGLKKDNFYKIKRELKKRNKPGKPKGKHKENQGNPPLFPPVLNEDKLLKMDWRDLIKLAALGKIELNIPALNFYEKQGYFNEDVEKQTGERYIYKRPEWLYPHQEKMLTMMHDGNIMVVGSRQTTGKTTAAFVGAYEQCYENDRFIVWYITASKDLSKELLAKTQMDEKLYNIYKDNTKMFLRESVIFRNNSRIIIRPCKLSALQGITGGVIYIDELDKILREKETRDAFASVLPVVIMYLINNEGHIWITCNQAAANQAGGLEFEYFKTILMKFGKFFPICNITENNELIIMNDFDIEIPDNQIDRTIFMKDFIYELQKAIAGEEFAAAQMRNVYLDRTGIWSKQDLLNAFIRFEEREVPKWDLIIKAVIGIDPGIVHGTGIVVVLRDMNGEVWVVFAKKRYGTEIHEDQFKQMIIDLYEEYNVDVIKCESNSGGLEWIYHWRNAGYNALATNFGTANEATGMVTNASKTIERHHKERVLKSLLEDKKIHIIKNETLFQEFSLYNPYENKVKGKGDIVDALLHAVFEIVGGMEYVLELLENEGIKEKGDAYVG